MEFTVHKTNIVLIEENKKDTKYLWVLVDKFGHTIIQVYSTEYPYKLVKQFE